MRPHPSASNGRSPRARRSRICAPVSAEHLERSLQWLAHSFHLQVFRSPGPVFSDFRNDGKGDYDDSPSTIIISVRGRAQFSFNVCCTPVTVPAHIVCVCRGGGGEGPEERVGGGAAGTYAGVMTPGPHDPRPPPPPPPSPARLLEPPWLRRWTALGRCPPAPATGGYRSLRPCVAACFSAPGVPAAASVPVSPAAFYAPHSPASRPPQARPTPPLACFGAALGDTRRQCYGGHCILE